MRKYRNCLFALVAAVCNQGVSAEENVDVNDVHERGAERKPLQTVVPAYPEKARRARIEGEVEVCFEVDRDGRPRRVAVRRSSNRVFEKPAREAVKASTYEPIEDGERLSGIKTCRTFRFSLEPVQAEDAPD